MWRGASAASAAAVLLLAAGAPPARGAGPASPEASGCPAAEAGLEDHPEVEQMRAVFVQSRLATVSDRSAVFGDPEQQAAGGPGVARLLRSAGALSMTAEERVKLVTPVAWFHVPKTGTSFCNTLYHTPGVCEFFPRENYIGDSTSAGSWDPTWRAMDGLCPGGFSATYRPATTGQHGGLDQSLWELNRGHLVTMLRQPEQRLISGYNHEGQMEWPFDTPAASLREYAEWMAGGTVRQLARGGGHASGELPVPTAEEVSVAVGRLRDGFAFVGVTEQWDLSVCLFRAMFGGVCVASDFSNTRLGNASTGSSLYDTSELYGFVDNYDGPVYAEALVLLSKGVELYGVDESKCTADCW
ncbi:unnamed protein product [Prorocentrum cordatum]|uniref:Phospholipase B-like n=1 Tax=Prorocentrum cordatum TaxID=2364126 RepID=A0ABN9UXW5_9DINO|nr:unnamed protein product [Polarella glacialis]